MPCDQSRLPLRASDQRPGASILGFVKNVQRRGQGRTGKQTLQGTLPLLASVWRTNIVRLRGVKPCQGFDSRQLGKR